MSGMLPDAIDILETIQFDIKQCLPRLKQFAAWHEKKKGRRAKKRG